MTSRRTGPRDSCGWWRVSRRTLRARARRRSSRPSRAIWPASIRPPTTATASDGERRRAVLRRRAHVDAVSRLGERPRGAARVRERREPAGDAAAVARARARDSRGTRRGPGRLARQLLTEGLLLSVAGGFAGVALARVSLGALVALAPSGLGRLDAVSINLPVLLISAASVLACGLALGLVPALIVWRVRPMTELRTSGVSLSTRPGFRHALVACEVALAVTLVVGAALFGESLLRLRRVDVASTKNLLTFDVAPSARARNTRRGRSRSSKRCCVTQGAAGRPRRGRGRHAAHRRRRLRRAGVPRGPADSRTGRRAARRISDCRRGRFATLGMRVVAGRDFTAQDAHRDAPVAMVNQTMASTVWPAQDPSAVDSASARVGPGRG